MGKAPQCLHLQQTFRGSNEHRKQIKFKQCLKVLLEWWPWETGDDMLIQTLSPHGYVPIYACQEGSTSSEVRPPTPVADRTTPPASDPWICTDSTDTADRGAQTENVPYENVPSVAQVGENNLELVISLMEQLLRRLLCPTRAKKL